MNLRDEDLGPVTGTTEVLQILTAVREVHVSFANVVNARTRGRHSGSTPSPISLTILAYHNVAYANSRTSVPILHA